MQKTAIKSRSPKSMILWQGCVFGTVMLVVHMVIIFFLIYPPQRQAYYDDLMLFTPDPVLVFHLIMTMILFFLAGHFAARQTGRTIEGWQAGAFGGIIYAISALFFSVLLFFFFPFFFREALCQGSCIFHSIRDGSESILVWSFLVAVLMEGALIGWLMGGAGALVALRRREKLVWKERLQSCFTIIMVLILVVVLAYMLANGIERMVYGIQYP